MRMRCLSVHQPWAGLLASGLKKVETRDWRHVPSKIVGERLAIHATLRGRPANNVNGQWAKANILADARGILELGGVGPSFAAAEEMSDEQLGMCLKFGSILCHGRVVRCEEGTPDDEPLALCETVGGVVIELADIVRLAKPIPWKGKQGFFWVEM